MSESEDSLLVAVLGVPANEGELLRTAALQTIEGGFEELLSAANDLESLFRIRLYFPNRSAAEGAIEQLRRAFAENSDSQVTVEYSSLHNELWVDTWKQYAKPVAVSASLTLAPSWCEPENDLGLVVRIDPQQAFGTGSHPTTLGCLRFLEELITSEHPNSLLDIGCGSGVLAIVADLLGVSEVLGIDIDEAAIGVAKQNASENNASRCEFRTTSLASIDRHYQLVCANIISSVLLHNWRDISRCVAPGGKLIISGVLESEEQLFFEQIGLRPLAVRRDEGWIAALLQPSA